MKWILVLPQVLLGQAIDMRACLLLILADHAPADSDVAIRILGIEDRKCDLRAGLHGARLHPSACSVDADFSVRVVEPYWRDLRGSVGHHGCDAGEGLFLSQEVEKFFRDCLRCHREYSFNDDSFRMLMGSWSRLDD